MCRDQFFFIRNRLSNLSKSLEVGCSSDTSLNLELASNLIDSCFSKWSAKFSNFTSEAGSEFASILSRAVVYSLADFCVDPLSSDFELYSIFLTHALDVDQVLIKPEFVSIVFIELCDLLGIVKGLDSFTNYALSAVTSPRRFIIVDENGQLVADLPQNGGFGRTDENIDAFLYNINYIVNAIIKVHRYDNKQFIIV